MPFVTQATNTMQISHMLSENKKMMLDVYSDLHDGAPIDLQKRMAMLDQIHSNLSYLCQAADYQPNSRYVLRQ